MAQNPASEQTPLFFPYTRKLCGFLVAPVSGYLDIIGRVIGQAQAMLPFFWKRRVNWEQIIEEAEFIGFDALGIALILSLFSGMVIALQVSHELVKQGAGQYVGALVAISTLRELAPIMTGFAVIALNGSAYAAQLGTMNIQNQIDALRVLHVSPSRYLILPKFLAAMWMVPLMSILSAMAGIIGGMVVSFYIADLNYSTYIESVWQQSQPMDVYACLIKGGVFGILIVLISTTFGMMTKESAREVGLNTQRAVVWSFVAMAVVDFVLSFILFQGH